jgi:RimJ/RimL family protein N-acetyltransferase
VNAFREKFERDEEEEPKPDSFYFIIRTLGDDQPIGFIGLSGIRWTHGDAWVSIGIGDRAYWGKGYGTDAMDVLLRYAFLELNLHRVSLSVHERNARAVRSYEKCGFVVEGRVRRFIRRDGQFEDLVNMGILRKEWERPGG